MLGELEKDYVSILQRDLCSYCLKRPKNIDHIDPTSKQGPNKWYNLTAACKKCNISKQAKPLLGYLLYRKEVLHERSSIRR